MSLEMCSLHWDKCKEAIRQRGLWHLVSIDGEEVMEKLKDRIENGEESQRSSYDPLVDLNIMLTSEALRCGGLYLMSPEEDFCPLCEAEKHTEDSEMGQIWIDGASDAIFDYCKEKGLQG